MYKAVQRFAKGKKPEDDLFDEIEPSLVNTHLKTLMDGLTIKARPVASGRVIAQGQREGACGAVGRAPRRSVDAIRGEH